MTTRSAAAIELEVRKWQQGRLLELSCKEDEELVKAIMGRRCGFSSKPESSTSDNATTENTASKLDPLRRPSSRLRANLQARIRAPTTSESRIYHLRLGLWERLRCNAGGCSVRRGQGGHSCCQSTDHPRAQMSDGQQRDLAHLAVVWRNHDVQMVEGNSKQAIQNLVT